MGNKATVKNFLTGNLIAPEGYFYVIRLEYRDGDMMVPFGWGETASRYSANIQDAIDNARFDSSYDFDPKYKEDEYEVKKLEDENGNISYDCYIPVKELIKLVEKYQPMIVLYQVKKGDEKSHEVAYWDEIKEPVSYAPLNLHAPLKLRGN